MSDFKDASLLHSFQPIQGIPSLAESLVSFSPRGLGCWSVSAGLKQILEVAGTVPELDHGPALTENTNMSCSVLLSKLYDDLKSDKERENFSKLCEDYVQ